MTLIQHVNDQVRFEQQVENSAAYVLPFIEQTHSISTGTTVLEIGCGEGGVLLPFVQRGCKVVGVDLDKIRIDLCNKFLQKEVAEDKAEFVLKNVYDDDFLQRFKGYFDIIILKDTIEHIPQQEKFIPYLKNFLKQDGQIFFGFPPWHMPFGGHQQLCKGKLASKLPYYHILPKPLYAGLLKMMGESKAVVNELLEISETGISIDRFERIVKNSGLTVMKKQHYLINPIYKYKFGLQPRKQYKLIERLPFIKDFMTTCVYYTVG